MLRVMNSNFKIIDTLKKYTFAQYEDKFREIGTFKVLAQLVKENNYLFDKKEQYYILFDEFTVGKVEKVIKDSDSEYDKTITITGRLAPVLLTQRVINSIVDFTGNSVDYIVTLLQMCFDLDNIDSSRYVNMNVATDDVSESKELSAVKKQVTGGYLWDEIQETMELDDLGLFLYPKLTSVYSDRLDIETNVRFWTLMLSSGTDRRVKNKEGNEAIIFSQSLSNISRTAYTKDSESYRNIAYVAGEGEGTDRKWYELKINQENSIGEQIGWNRFELWIDARDLQSEDSDGNKLTQEQYETNIKNRANEKAKENDVSNSYESTVTVRNLEYRKDFDKGDLVTIKDDELGVIIDAQIIAVTVTEQDSKTIVDVTLQYGSRTQNKIEQIDSSIIKIEQFDVYKKFLENKLKYSGKIAKRNAKSGQLYRIGNVVHFHHELITTPVMKDLNWQIIPEGYKPITIERQSFGTLNNDNINCWITVSINPDGRCSYFSTKSELTEFFFDMYYFTGDAFPKEDAI